MSDVLFIKNETDLQYYKSLRPKIKYAKLKFKYICNKCGKENGCDYLVDYDYTKPEDFDFDDKEDDND